MRYLWVLGALLLPLSCQKAARSQKYELVVRVESDPGKPLAGAEIFYESRRIGSSGEDGQVMVAVKGVEGSVLRFLVRCPAGYTSPAATLQVKLRRSSDSSRRPEYSATCAPLSRTLVVAIRSGRGANLPVRYLGQEIARTDEAGTAHVVFRGAPSDKLELVLDTTQAPALRPQNPSARFEIPQRDDIQLFDQDFVVERPRRKGGGGSRPTKSNGPVRILAR